MRELRSAFGLLLNWVLWFWFALSSWFVCANCKLKRTGRTRSVFCLIYGRPAAQQHVGPLMDEQQQFEQVLDAARAFLPSAVVATCESLNGHGEWELALGHCESHLVGVELPAHVAELFAACALRFRGQAGLKPNSSFNPDALTRAG